MRPYGLPQPPWPGRPYGRHRSHTVYRWMNDHDFRGLAITSVRKAERPWARLRAHCRSQRPVLSFDRPGGEELDEAKQHLLKRLRVEILDDRVIGAIERVPREEFVPESDRHLAYEDTPIPIGHGQTISQPYIVALMVRALELRSTDKVLEIGTGSGYQAAILAELAGEIISAERVPDLAESALETLRDLRYTTVEVNLATVQLGWPERAPYDSIIVAAGAPKLPRELMEQMAAGARLVVPVGSRESQELMKVTRTAETYSVETLGACRFVPLIGDGAWPERQAEG